MLVGNNFDYKKMSDDELVYVCGLGMGVMPRAEIDNFLKSVEKHIFSDFVLGVHLFEIKYRGQTEIPLIAFNNKGMAVILNTEKALSQVKYIEAFGYPNNK